MYVICLFVFLFAFIFFIFVIYIISLQLYFIAVFLYQLLCDYIVFISDTLWNSMVPNLSTT